MMLKGCQIGLTIAFLLVGATLPVAVPAAGALSPLVRVIMAASSAGAAAEIIDLTKSLGSSASMLQDTVVLAYPHQNSNSKVLVQLPCHHACAKTALQIQPCCLQGDHIAADAFLNNLQRSADSTKRSLVFADTAVSSQEPTAVALQSDTTVAASFPVDPVQRTFDMLQHKAEELEQFLTDLGTSVEKINDAIAACMHQLVPLQQVPVSGLKQ